MGYSGLLVGWSMAALELIRIQSLPKGSLPRLIETVRAIRRLFRDDWALEGLRSRGRLFLGRL